MICLTHYMNLTHYMIAMTTGDLSKLDKAEKREFISAVNTAILKQKYRIVVRRIFKQYTYNDTTYFIKEYTVQKRKKFLFFHWWDFCDRDERGWVKWTEKLEDCEKYIYDKYLGTDVKPTFEVLGLIPSE